MGKVLIYDPVLRRPKNLWVNEPTLKLIQQMRKEKGLPPVVIVEHERKKDASVKR